MSQYPTTTRGSNITILLPDGEALRKCFEITSRSETADYLVKQCRAISGLPADVLKVVESVARKIHFQDDNRANPFLGNPADILNSEAHFQKMVAAEAAKVVRDNVSEGLHLGFATNKDSNILRAISVNKQLVNPDVAAAQDELFGAFLYKHHAICVDGTIFATEDAVENNVLTRRIETNSKNEPVKLSEDRINQLMTDPGKDGYAAFLKGHGIEIAIQKRAYPAEKVAPVATEQAITPARPAIEAPEQMRPEDGIRND